MRIDREAPLRFLKTAFLPDDWIAVLLKRSDTGEAVQRVGPVSMVLNPRFQSWLRFKNVRRFNVFVSVNALTPGRRSRRRESIAVVRHVFLDADQAADRVVGAIADRSDLPPPSYIVRSSEGRAHVLWRVEAVSVERAEATQKHLARELGTDMAATSAAQMTRLPGLFNHKYNPPQLVEFDDRRQGATLGCDAFPDVRIVTMGISRVNRHVESVPMVERARRYLAATPPAVQGQRGDATTFRVCCSLLRHFDLTDQEVLKVLIEWNATCVPPWSDRDLATKVRSARRTLR